MINPHVAGGVKDAGTLAFELQPLLGRQPTPTLCTTPLSEAFWAALKSVRIDPALLFRKSGLSPNFCSSGYRMISTEQNFRIWHTLGEVSDDPAIGLKMVTLNPARHPADIAAEHAPTFGDALRYVACSATLNFSEHMRIVKKEDECSIEFTGALLNEAAPALFLDTAFAYTLEIGRN